MDIRKFNEMKCINEISPNGNSREIGVPVFCPKDESIELDELIFRDNGVLVFYGNYNLSVGKISNQKDDTAQVDFEFAIMGKDGENSVNSKQNGGNAEDGGKVTIRLRDVEGKIHFYAQAGCGGNGHDGDNGKCGGNGGDGYQGGNGGNGEDAHAGTDGGNGGAAPNAVIRIDTLSKGSAIYVNGKEIKRKKYSCVIPGGKGGEGGRAGKKGIGGIGGKGFSAGLNGQNGADGKEAKDGQRGVCGKPGHLTVFKPRRESLLQTLENHQGLYVFDLTDDEEFDYCVEKMGGIKKLSAQQPHLLESMRSQNSSSYEEKKPCISINASKISYIKRNEMKGDGLSSNSDNVILEKSFTYNLYDNVTDISDPTAAKKWKYLNAELNVYLVPAPGLKIPLINTNYEFYDSNGGTEEFRSDPIDPDSLSGNLVTSMFIRGYNADNIPVFAEYHESEIPQSNNVKKYTVTDIKINDPHWNKFHDGIVMLYNRNNISNPDYSGGDYYNNVIKSGNKVATLMPVTGTFTLSINYKPVGLKKPDEIGFVRSTLNYDEKSASWLTPDVVYQNSITDNKTLYDHMIRNKCFVAHEGVGSSTVDFDLRLDLNDGRSKLDWRNDISGIDDQHKRTVFLRGAFEYAVRRKDARSEDADSTVTISIISISKENLAKLNKGRTNDQNLEYYKFTEGRNIIYIPPIYIYWGCLGKDVQLTAADGSLVKASEVKVGDRLISHDGRIITVSDIVTGEDENIYRIRLSNGMEALMSGSHPVLSEDGTRINVHALTSENRIMTEKGLAKVELLKKEPYNDTVYNFSFKDEDKGVYIIANGIYAGDFNVQNQSDDTPEETPEEKKKTQVIIDELRSVRVDM